MRQKRKNNNRQLNKTERLRPLSLYPLKPEDVLRAIMNVKPKENAEETKGKIK